MLKRLSEGWTKIALGFLTYVEILHVVILWQQCSVLF